MGEGERRDGGVQAAAIETRATVPSALEDLFREHNGAVYRAAYRITGNAMDAEDVLQTVFMRLLRREDGFVRLSERGLELSDSIFVELV